MANGKQTEIPGLENSIPDTPKLLKNLNSRQLEISFELIFYALKVFSEIALADNKGLNITQIKAKFENQNQKNIRDAISKLEQLGYIEEKDISKSTEKRYLITSSTLKKLKECCIPY